MMDRTRTRGRQIWRRPAVRAVFFGGLICLALAAPSVSRAQDPSHAPDPKVLLQQIKSSVSVALVPKNEIIPVTLDAEGQRKIQQHILTVTIGLDAAQQAVELLAESDATGNPGFDPKAAGKEIAPKLERASLKLAQMARLHQRIWSPERGVIPLLQKRAEALQGYLEELLYQGASAARRQEIQRVADLVMEIRDAEQAYFKDEDLTHIARLMEACREIEAGLSTGPLTRHEADRIDTYLRYYLIVMERLMLGEIMLVDTRRSLSKAAAEVVETVDTYVNDTPRTEAGKVDSG